MSNGDEAQVTYVGGRAIEQSEGLDSNLETDEREAAKEAVRKAIQEAGESAAKDSKTDKAKDPYKPPGAKKEPKEPKEPREPKEAKTKNEASDDDSDEESTDGTRERGPDGKFLSKKESKSSVGDSTGTKKSKNASDSEDGDGDNEELPDLDKASVKQLLKAREKVAAAKKEAANISKQNQEFQQQQVQLQQAYAQLQAEQQRLARERQAMQALRQDPARAIRELGYDPEQFILDLATDGTPEGQARKRQQEIDNQLAEIRNWREAQAKAYQEQQRQAQMEQVINHRSTAVKTFLQMGMDDDKYPHISNFYSGNERALVAFGDLVAEEYRNLSDGKEAGYGDILDYIEDQLADKAKRWYTRSVPKGQKVEPKTLDTGKPKSKGKSLSPEQSGERRTMKAKDLKDLDAEERIEAAKQAVRVALSHSDDD